MRRLGLIVLPFALAALVLLVGAGVPAGPGAPAAAEAAKKCRKGYALHVVKGKRRCVKRCPKGFQKRTVKRVVRCVRVRPPSTTAPGGTTPPQNTTEPGGQGGSTTPSTPAFDPKGKYVEILAKMYLLRTYQVPKPGQHQGYNTHREEYGWCDPGTGRRMVHYYEGISFIYRTNGPYSVLEGTASEDGKSGAGVVRYTQESANFDEERGKTLDIKISWEGDFATVQHPEIGVNQFSKLVRANESCS
jgi:hypothetical protein